MSRIDEVIKNTAVRCNVTEFKTKKVVDNLFLYLRNSMTKLESGEYYLPKFGKFQIINKRYEKYKNKLTKNERRETSDNE